MKFFHKDKYRNNGSKIHANIHGLHSEDIITITDDLKHKLEEEEDITLGLKRLQNHDAFKIG